MALIPPIFMDCVVALGTRDNGKKKWIASGFLYGHFLRKLTEEQNQYLVYLVTNRHVFNKLDSAFVRFNPNDDKPAQEYSLPLRDAAGVQLWTTHPDPEVDVAVTGMNTKLFDDQGIKYSFFREGSDVADRAKAFEIGITEGDGIFLLGFPLGLVGGQRNFVIVREGGIARIRDTLAGTSKEFLVDAFVFPGNSGGPVVTKPELTHIKGTKSQNRAYLIGMVRSYVPYQDIAISQQTGRPRVTFEENSGLASVIPIDFVQETVQENMKSLASPPVLPKGP